MHWQRNFSLNILLENDHSINYIKDDHLKRLCTKSKAAWKEWKNAGKTTIWRVIREENLYKKRNSKKKRINILRARRDHFNSEHIDKKFTERAHNRFHMHHCGSATGSQLVVNDSLITKQEDVTHSEINVPFLI